MKNWVETFGRIQFWGWNICAVFLFTYLIGFLILPWAFIALLSSEIPVSIFLCILLLVLLPFISVWVVVKKPDIVVPYFFGVQLPLVALALMRMGMMRDMSWGGALLIYTALFAGAAFTWQLMRQPAGEEELPPPSEHLRPFKTLAMTAILITGIFTAILSFLYAVPVLMGTLKGFFSFGWVEALPYFPIILPFMLVFLFSGVAFFCFPFYVGYYYPKTWWQSRSGNVKSFLGVTAAMAALWLGAHHLTYRSNVAPFVADYSVMAEDEKKQVWQNPEPYRKQLLKAYLNEYRYLGTTERRNNLIPIYDDVFWDGTFLGQMAQNMQNYLLQPLTYRGKRADRFKAAKIYSELFDTPIQRAERGAIKSAIEASYNRDEVTAGLMNVGIRNVAIEDQTIRALDQGDYAVIEIEERYRNLTQQPQEIFYYFSLPEDAVMTGVWIGQTRNRDEMDAFIVAPRGAAQEVYEQQVRRRIDPAHLEQVGPGQYRLRVFPIPVTRWRAENVLFDSRTRRRPPPELMSLHMQYVVPRSPDGFALPVLSEKRNVDWTRKTDRRLNGKIVKSKSWMPERFVPAKMTGPLKMSVTIGDQTVSATAVDSSDAQMPSGSYVVIADRSYSMKSRAAELEAAMKTLGQWASGGSGFKVIYDPDLKTTGFGGSASYQDLLNGILPNHQDYDGVILLTDKGRYGENDNNPVTARLSGPLWLWHMGPAPSAMDDSVLDLIYRSGGGVVGSADDLRQALIHKDARVTSGRIWSISDAPDTTLATDFVDNDAVRSLAARQVILQGSFGAKPDLTTLDEFHRLAKTYDVVSPYSSMIVLVNERQKEALKKASEEDDRFDREGRSGTEQLTSPNNPMVSAVPEPHEWLLIILSLVILFWLYRRREQVGNMV